MPRRSALWSGDPQEKPPFGSVEINFAHRLAPTGVCWLINEGGGNLIDLVTGRTGVLTTGPSHGASARGLALRLSGSNDVRSSGAFVTAPPFSLHVWFTTDNVSGVKTLAAIASTTSDGSYHRLFLFDDDVGAQSSDVGNNSFARTASVIVANKWHLASGVWASTASRKAYLDAGDEATNTVSRVPGSLNTTDLGVNRNNAGVPERLPGQIGLALLYPVAHSQNDIRWLAAEPYIFLRPIVRRRYFVPAAGGAAEIPQLIMRPVGQFP